jgi:hypothetical protein
MGAVGVPGGAGADELCKSVEVHSSGSGNMAQSLTIARLERWGQNFRTGVVWARRMLVTFVAILIGRLGRRSCAPQRQSSLPPQLQTTASSRISSASTEFTFDTQTTPHREPSDSEASSTSRTHVADGE